MIAWFHYFYVPTMGPWYAGNVWGNVFVIAVIAPLGWAWSRTKFWPLRPIKHGVERLHDKVDALHARHDEHDRTLAELGRSLAELHAKHDAAHPPPVPPPPAAIAKPRARRRAA